VVVDPNRGERARFSRGLEERGFAVRQTFVDRVPGLAGRYRGRLLEYSR
jgi:hypothetical protein